MNFLDENQIKAALSEAIKAKDEAKINEALSNLLNLSKNRYQVALDEYKATNDKAILERRGYRTLTSKEKEFYKKFAEAIKSETPQAALTDLLKTTHGMPETIIEDVYRDLQTEHPLLKKIQFKYVGYLTSWLLTDKSSNIAIWGDINSEITKKLESAFKNISITQGKLSAFLILPKGMLALGPTFLDNYVRTVLKEALALGLETGIIKGTGAKGEPIGLARSIKKGVSHNDETGYPLKTKIVVKNFMLKNYCDLVAKLAKRENGTAKKIDSVDLIVNPIDYLTKIIPASTFQGPDGLYRGNLFPVPTNVIQSTAVNEGEAILCILDEYFLGFGQKDAGEGVIEYSDHYKFVEDARTYIIKLFAAGRATDESSAIYLDISNLEPSYIVVKPIADATDATSLSSDTNQTNSTSASGK